MPGVTRLRESARNVEAARNKHQQEAIKGVLRTGRAGAMQGTPRRSDSHRIKARQGKRDGTNTPPSF